MPVELITQADRSFDKSFIHKFKICLEEEG